MCIRFRICDTDPSDFVLFVSFSIYFLFLYRVFPLPIFLYIIKDKIADERRSVSPPVTPMPHYRKLQNVHVGQRWWFSGEGEANAGIENVLQTCLAISEVERKREERERGTNRMTTANQ